MGVNVGGYEINSSSAKLFATNDIILNGLVLHLDTANISSYPGSGTSWYDLSYNGITTTLNNSPTFSGFNGGYLIFNGSNQNVTVSPSSIPFGNQISFCVWNYGITTQQSSVVESRDIAGARTLNIHLPWADGTIYFDCGGDRLSQAAGSTYLGWNYWCFTKNTSTGAMVIYRNGTSWASSAGNTGTINATTVARLCSYAIDTTYHNAYLGNVQLYDRTLSSTEVLLNYNIQKGRFGL
jgi:hypothetical protein